jgi:CRP/FNR family transcriptional regulator, cyclic AMP receptor protein
MVTQADGALGSARLLELDPELGEGLGPAALEQAHHAFTVPVVDAPPGSWSPDAVCAAGIHPFALMVVEGLVVRDLLIAGNAASELLGAGDVVDHQGQRGGLLPAVSRWTIAQPARIAVLDERLLPLLRAQPVLAARLVARSTQYGTRLAAQRAISQLPRVEDRLLALFGHLAERWGRVGTAGIIVPLRLTHETLGRLVGARRPTVSLALKDLAGQGVVVRRDDGAWILRHGALEALASGNGHDARAQPPDARLVAVGGSRWAARRVPAAHAPGADDRAALLARARHLRETHHARVAHHRDVLARGTRPR